MQQQQLPKGVCERSSSGTTVCTSVKHFFVDVYSQAVEASWPCDAAQDAAVESLAGAGRHALLAVDEGCLSQGLSTGKQTFTSHLQAQVAEKMLENLELRKAMHTAKAASEPTILQVSPLSNGLAASWKAADGHTPCMQSCCISKGPAVPAGVRWLGTGQL